jgi:ATP-binding cassette subfamily F protein uup
VEFGGTVLLVSHDRAFLNEVSTSLLVFEGDGAISEYIGGYDDWQRERARKAAAAVERVEGEGRARKNSGAGNDTSTMKKTRKLSNKERVELEALPAKIEALEAEQEKLTATLADPAFFKKGGAEVAKATARLHEIESELLAVYARWEELGG